MIAQSVQVLNSLEVAHLILLKKLIRRGNVSMTADEQNTLIKSSSDR